MYQAFLDIAKKTQGQKPLAVKTQANNSKAQYFANLNPFLRAALVRSYFVISIIIR